MSEKFSSERKTIDKQNKQQGVIRNIVDWCDRIDHIKTMIFTQNIWTIKTTNVLKVVEIYANTSIILNHLNVKFKTWYDAGTIEFHDIWQGQIVFSM